MPPQSAIWRRGWKRGEAVSIGRVFNCTFIRGWAHVITPSPLYTTYGIVSLIPANNQPTINDHFSSKGLWVSAVEHKTVAIGQRESRSATVDCVVQMNKYSKDAFACPNPWLICHHVDAEQVESYQDSTLSRVALVGSSLVLHSTCG